MFLNLSVFILGWWLVSFLRLYLVNFFFGIIALKGCRLVYHRKYMQNTSLFEWEWKEMFSFCCKILFHSTRDTNVLEIPNRNLRSNWTCTEYQRASTARKSLLFFFSRKIPVWELFVKPLHSLITPYILLNTSRSLGSFCQVVRAYSVCRKHHLRWCTDLKGLMETPLCQLHRLSQVKCIH